MHYEQTIIQKCFAIPESKYTFWSFFIQGDVNKYTLYMYCYRKSLKKGFFFFANYQFCNVVNQDSEGVELFRK